MNDDSTGYDASDPGQVRAAKRAAGRKKKDEHKVWKAIMQLPQGREAIYRLLESWHVHGGQVFYPDSVRNTDFALGMQNAGRMFDAMIQAASPDDYILMLKEQLDVRRSTD